MPLFKRRVSPADADLLAASDTPRKHASPASGHSRLPGAFGQWLKGTVLDLVTLAAMGGIALGVFMLKPVPRRQFPITYLDDDVIYPQLAYPRRKEIMPSWAVGLLAILVPVSIFMLYQIRSRSFLDVNNATIGLLYSVISASVFQVLIKWLIGGPRPNFLAVCKPTVDRVPLGKGYRNIMYDRSICTGDKKDVDYALKSMPSGHTSFAFASFVFLYLYLNAKLKVFSNRHAAMWKLVVIHAPLLGACLIGGTLTVDKSHHWYDIVAGAVIGMVFAFSAYRMVYASVWDFRFNHIPLQRQTGFLYETGTATSHGSHDQIYKGAPHDAASGSAPAHPEPATTDKSNAHPGLNEPPKAPAPHNTAAQPAHPVPAEHVV